MKCRVWIKRGEQLPVDQTDARKPTVRRFGRSDRRAQNDKPIVEDPFRAEENGRTGINEQRIPGLPASMNPHYFTAAFSPAACDTISDHNTAGVNWFPPNC
jgi:hypothetical protein